MEYNIRIDKELHDFIVGKKLVREESYNSVIKRLVHIRRYLIKDKNKIYIVETKNGK